MEEKYYQELINLTKKASNKGDVPVSAIIVRNDKIIAKALNKRNAKKNTLYHAELLAINKACKKLKKWILDDCNLYVTLKPCSMCEGAIRQARIKNVFYLANKPDTKKEYFKTNFTQTNNSLQSANYLRILKDFFKNKRDKK